MSFEQKIKEFSIRIGEIKTNISTEEATKTAIILPFFALLGYDVFNPMEFVPEFVADVGIKRGEKVDYAIVKNAVPTILIEAKSINKKLEKHDSQLFRYFGTTKARLAILTNGIQYRLYTDIEEANKMDQTPFYEFNLLNLSDDDISEIQQLERERFDETKMFENASILKYSNIFKSQIEAELLSPSDDFVRYFLKSSYKGVKTQAVVDKFAPVLRKAIGTYVNDLVKQNLTNMVNASGYAVVTAPEPKKNEATALEIDCVVFIKSLLNDIVDMETITYKKTESYIAILLNNNVRKWIARLVVNDTQISLSLPGDTSEQKRKISSLQELESYKAELIKSLEKYLHKTSVDEVELSTVEEPSPLLQQLVQGQKIKLSSMGIANTVNIKIPVAKEQKDMLDISCFAVTADNQLVDDAYFIFYNQLSAPDESIKMTIDGSTSITLELEKLPDVVNKLVFTMACDGDMTMADMKDTKVSIGTDASSLLAFQLKSSDFTTEKSIIICEIYRREDDWTLSLVASGFNGGMESLLLHFGGQAE